MTDEKRERRTHCLEEYFEDSGDAVLSVLQWVLKGAGSFLLSGISGSILSAATSKGLCEI